MNENYRTKPRVEFLKKEINALKKHSSDHEDLYKELKCQICMEMPTNQVYNCQICNNPICDMCLEGLTTRQPDTKKCPSCREDLKNTPMVRNKLVERIISQIKF